MAYKTAKARKMRETARSDAKYYDYNRIAKCGHKATPYGGCYAAIGECPNAYTD